MTLRQRFLKNQSKFLLQKRGKGFKQTKAVFQKALRAAIDFYARDPSLENLANAKYLLEFVRNIKNQYNTAQEGML